MSTSKKPSSSMTECLLLAIEAPLRIYAGGMRSVPSQFGDDQARPNYALRPGAQQWIEPSTIKACMVRGWLIESVDIEALRRGVPKQYATRWSITEDGRAAAAEATR